MRPVLLGLLTLASAFSGCLTAGLDRASVETATDLVPFDINVTTRCAAP